jgi:EAL domain-containing protein (putative c-di-GMP-specific phosphodiesterase class I)
VLNVDHPAQKLCSNKYLSQGANSRSIDTRSECAAIISATLTLAQNLGIATTAEGVETADQYRLLRLAGVTSLQGYLFKRPFPAQEIDFNTPYCGVAIEDAA